VPVRGHDSLRIVVIAPPFYEVPPLRYGGIERVCFALVEGLLDRGHDVTLIGVGPRHTCARYIATDSVAPTEHVTDHVAVEVRHALIGARAVTDLRPDIVHDHTRAGLIAAVGRTCPTVVTVHTALAGPESHLETYRALGSVAALVAVSDAQLADAPGLNWVARVHNGIRLEDHPVVRQTAEHVLYLGRLNATKGVDLAIAAARRSGHPLILAGDCTSESEREYAERIIKPLLGRGVHWVGEVDDAAKRQLFAAAGCLVLPVRWHEPFGLVVVEAMASGVPVVAMRAGALPELVDDGATGVLCDEADDLPLALNRAMAMDGSACRAWVERRFDAERMVDEYEAVYRRIYE
jgi:glycosyltransferase involved in cell wall biosynthesis